MTDAPGAATLAVIIGEWFSAWEERRMPADLSVLQEAIALLSADEKQMLQKELKSLIQGSEGWRTKDIRVLAKLLPGFSAQLPASRDGERA